MTFTITSEVDDAHPPSTAAAELSNAYSAALHIGGNCLTDGAVGQVGLEIEAHCFDLADPMKRPSWDQLTATIADLPQLPGGSRVTVEPGGAVELSGPPMPGALPAITAMTADREVLRGAFARAGLGLVLLGADPLRPPARVNPGARYRAMEMFFDASQTGAAGAAMMTSTASVQVNLDAGPRDGWADRVRLAHALGPVMIAVAANSPLLGGRFSGWRSTRQRVWSQLDSARCGPILGSSGDDPASEWARYALKAPVMLVNDDATGAAEPVTQWVPFADWAEGRVLLGGRRPTQADLNYHLTTLFPPVRPRRWLEIRYLDSVPEAVWPALVFTLVTLLDDPQAAELAAEVTESVATAWDRAAQIGLGDRRLWAAAQRCVLAAAERAPAGVQESMQQLVRSVEQGRCPADDFADRAVKHGIAPAVAQLAQGET
ncbi:ergothioneine biosynthesis glutamate--cysteine ligase EgtA [Mycobacterium sp. IDR2000157661]|uniref:ergothioneine biosynthesis glutamate--cysteine ligase EgtA n=1 Tax=Mycobacterium sp. IDR2000157661 TaxID=2867005 RepID=UPI001EED3FB3|nr:ergothioneine biosynthesis glutamate--cysteine ligase EgtA [Mycobacterium sp. IDR2000157661]ULE34998.1 ergothioneine biosynthesis glutamate--cysteine ligase EgtA [Mycobacterium sp. IDR2000157661]